MENKIFTLIVKRDFERVLLDQRFFASLEEAQAFEKAVRLTQPYGCLSCNMETNIYELQGVLYYEIVESKKGYFYARFTFDVDKFYDVIEYPEEIKASHEGIVRVPNDCIYQVLSVDTQTLTPYYYGESLVGTQMFLCLNKFKDVDPMFNTLKIVPRETVNK